MGHDPFDRLALHSRVALVTGASGGIGRAVANLLARRGADVAVHFFSGRSAAEAVAGEIVTRGRRAHIVGCDLRSGEEVQRMVEQVASELGEIEILVNNAARWHKASFLDTDAVAWGDQLATNLTGAYHCIRAVLPGMIQRRRGAIVNVSSQAALSGGAPMISVPYAAGKAALESLTRGLAREVGPEGVRINGVRPSTIETAMLDPQFAAAAVPAAGLRRLGQPGEVAEVVAFLASDAASYVTGEVISVAGGR